VPTEASTEDQAAARRIERWMKELPSFHRGAFSLRYTPREWPECLVERFGDETSLVVRLECTKHPAVGKSGAALEAASIERLTVAIAAGEEERERRKNPRRDFSVGPEERPLVALMWRAHQHIESAVRAFAKVRGHAACVLPNWVEEAVDECD
jgi:hypothetical protein